MIPITVGSAKMRRKQRQSNIYSATATSGIFLKIFIKTFSVKKLTKDPQVLLTKILVRLCLRYFQHIKIERFKNFF